MAKALRPRSTWPKVYIQFIICAIIVFKNTQIIRVMHFILHICHELDPTVRIDEINKLICRKEPWRSDKEGPAGGRRVPGDGPQGWP